MTTTNRLLERIRTRGMGLPLSLALAIALGALPEARGATLFWFGDAGPYWNTSGNWGTTTVPSVTVSQISGNLPATMTLFTADALAGATDLSSWTINGLSGGRAQIQGTSIILKMGYQGTVIAIR